MRIVTALGGNALLRRGEAPTAENQRRNVKDAATALAPIVNEHQVVVSHGNGPQVGLLALQSAAYQPEGAYPLDILDAETEGMIGYLIEQELTNVLPAQRRCVTLLTQIEVDPADPGFVDPTKPIGPVYGEPEARALARERGWRVRRDGKHFRRVVASPRPQRIFELSVIQLLLDQDIVVICAGGGGIPVVRRKDGSLIGVEAVIDKDLASALLAREVDAQVLLMLTDVAAVYQDWGTARARAIRRITPQALARRSFTPGTMGPKVEAACEFVEYSRGIAAIGRLHDADDVLRGGAGTTVALDAEDVTWWD